MKNHFFKTFEFEFETTRLLWYTPSGGSDYGEVATTAEKIKDGNYESWYKGWSDFAKKLEERSDNFKSQSSKANGYLRASRYYQAAEFFLSANDSRKIEAYQKSVKLFYKSLDLQKVKYVSEMINYKNVKSELYFLEQIWNQKVLYLFVAVLMHFSKNYILQMSNLGWKMGMMLCFMKDRGNLM